MAVNAPSRPDVTASDVIKLGGVPATHRRALDGIRWGFLLVTFMRVVAALWMLEGLMYWRMILMPTGLSFEALRAPVATAVVFFAVANLLAAVGLWLATPWGGVLWLFTAIVGIMTAIVLPDLMGGGRILTAADLALIVAYFVLTWYAAKQEDA
jgi:hypothetical protein